MDQNEKCLKIKEALGSLPADFLKVAQWNPNTVKVEISSNVFEGLKRLDRFALLDALLKEKLPDLFGATTFIYKAFTADEWELRTLREST